MPLTRRYGDCLTELSFVLIPARSYNTSMAKVKVYRVEVYDAISDKWSISPRLATREGVAIMHGKIVEETEPQIDDSQLEDGEKWTPRDCTP